MEISEVDLTASIITSLQKARTSAGQPSGHSFVRRNNTHTHTKKSTHLLWNPTPFLAAPEPRRTQEDLVRIHTVLPLHTAQPALT